MLKLVLLRHGESTWNLENRFTGWTDVDLTPKGIAKALDNGHRPSPGTRAALEQLRGSLETLGSAGYGRQTELDLLTLNTALEQGTHAVRQLRWRKMMRIG